MELILGGGKIPRIVTHADQRLIEYRNDSGRDYLDHKPNTPPDELVLEDLAVTLLVNSQARIRAASSMLEPIDIGHLPDMPLEATSEEDREKATRMIGEVCRPGIMVSIATKMLHKKRPGLIPVLDNHAIFGAYMNPYWPKEHSSGESVAGSDPRVREALDWIAYDLKRPENLKTWQELRKIEQSRTLIELFDSVWWIEFRRLEPRPSAVGRRRRKTAHH